MTTAAAAWLANETAAEAARITQLLSALVQSTPPTAEALFRLRRAREALGGGPDLDAPPPFATPPGTPEAEAGLSPRLRQTLRHLLEGDSLKQVARKLQLSPHTVHLYVTALHRHFRVHSRAELLALFLRAGRPNPTTPADGATTAGATGTDNGDTAPYRTDNGDTAP